jgi:hypothetical protein
VLEDKDMLRHVPEVGLIGDAPYPHNSDGKPAGRRLTFRGAAMVLPAGLLLTALELALRLGDYTYPPRTGRCLDSLLRKQ